MQDLPCARRPAYVAGVERMYGSASWSDDVSEHFHSIFRRAACPAARAKFLSRLFGIFSEEIVSLWAQDDRAPYRSLGRPTIKVVGTNRGHTLDFTLRERTTGKVFVA